MLFNNLSNKLQEIVIRFENFIESNVEYYKLRAFKISMKMIVSLINIFIFGGLSLFILVFLSIGFALWLGEVIGSSYAGFLLIGGFFVLLLLMMLIFGRKLIGRLIIQNFSEILFEEDELTPEEVIQKERNRLHNRAEDEKHNTDTSRRR